MSNFFRNFVEQIKDDDTSIMADGKGSAEFSGTIDTGSYIMNAVLSGSLYGGIPNNKITAFAGESATGKTFFVLGIVKSFLDQNPNAGVVYYDTEAAVTKNMMEERGIDTQRVVIAEVDTVQKFRHHALKMIDSYEKVKEKERPPMMFILDSLGQLSSTKEMEDTAEGKETRDMTKAQIIKAAFRVLTLRLAKVGVPMLVTNHVYAAMGSMFPTNEMAGGSGLKYSASTIAMLSKRKEKDGNEVIGNIVHVKMYKSRLSKENKMVDVLLTYKDGLDRWYGLLELAERHGVFKKVSTRFEMPDGSKVFGKTINDNPEKYFTKEVMAMLEAAANKEFRYGSGDEPVKYDPETGEINETDE
jgi:RecA/RadA recombinase